jgi:hypothetical protein
MNQVLLLMYSKICYAMLLQIDVSICHGVKCLLQFGLRSLSQVNVWRDDNWIGIVEKL